MNNEIIIALIAGLSVAIPSILATKAGFNSNRELLNYRLDQIEEKQDQYNDVIRRTFILEEKYKAHDNRISKLEREWGDKNDKSK